VGCEDWGMGTEKTRVWRTITEKRRIVELTLQPGMSVARVAQAEGVNSHQVFQWRRAYRQGTLGDAASGCAALLPVVISVRGGERHEPDETSVRAGSSGTIHIELPGHATITAEYGADSGLLRAILEALHQ
jgi:transposase